MSEAATPEDGAMTRAQAVASLVAADTVEQSAPEAPVEAAEEPEIEVEASPTEETEAEPETPAEGEVAEEATEAETLAAPLYWKPEAKEAFAALPPAVQAEILAQEGPREESAAKAKAEAAAEVARAQKDMQGVQALAQQLGEFLPRAVEAFNQRWGEPDWAAVAEEQGADRAFVLKAQYETEQKLLAQTAQATQTAMQEARKAELQTEWKVLGEIAPEFTDPAKGPVIRTAVSKYLVDGGISPEAVHLISAREMVIAHKAMLWDQAQAALKAKPAPKPVAPAAKSPVRPAAAAPQQNTPQREAERLKNRFAQTRSRQDAAELIIKLGL